MRELFSLGELYVSDFLKDSEKPRAKSELKLLLDDNGAVRLEKTAPANTMWGKYFYRSGTNATMKNALKDIVISILDTMKLEENDLWIDVASNDGTLLSFVPTNIIRIGIDPAEDSYRKEAEKHSNLIIQDYFSAKVFKQSKFGNLKAKVVTSIAMFYDLERPDKFIEDINEVLDDNGVWVMQLSYTPLMLKQLAFDNILQEHYYYYSLFNLKTLLNKHGFKIVDCKLNDVNGGSFRVYIMKENGDETKFATQPFRDVCNFRIESLLAYEQTLKLDCVETWLKFYDDINKLKTTTVSFLKQAKAEGKTVYGYGASSKGNTLLQYFGIDNTMLDAIADRSQYKWGLKTVGTNIPICSEQEMRKTQPDYLLILPWHFLNEFLDREKEYLDKGGHLIVPLPKFILI